MSASETYQARVLRINALEPNFEALLTTHYVPRHLVQRHVWQMARRWTMCWKRHLPLFAKRRAARWANAIMTCSSLAAASDGKNLGNEKTKAVKHSPPYRALNALTAPVHGDGERLSRRA